MLWRLEALEGDALALPDTHRGRVVRKRTLALPDGWGREGMEFYEVFERVVDLLRRQGRVSYRALKRQFALDDDYLEDLKAELIAAKRLAVDEQGTVLVWIGEAPSAATLQSPTPPESPEPPPAPGGPDAAALPAAVAERRQLTVMFCDLVDSTTLAVQRDPEELRDMVRAYQAACARVIVRFEGHIVQYLGDGLLVYFGYPLAHEDDAQRAVRAGLGIIEAIRQLNTRLAPERGVHLAIRLGVHTGLVVVGDVGDGTRQEQLALGETPNLAARLQGIAAPNTLVISAATWQLLRGFFACQPLGAYSIKGFTQPLEVYQVLYESTARSRLEAAGSTGLTPMVGQEQEIGLLLERWAQVKDGHGQVVLLSGEAGIGKSRLVQVLKEQVASEPQAWLTPCQCSPYHQNTALYPMIDLLERVVLQFGRDETPQQKLSKLEGHLARYGLPLAEAVPLYATLLSLPLSAAYAPLTLSPAQQKQQTMHVLLATLLRIAAQQPVLFVMEDLHWSDPSTREFLGLLVDQGPTARILALLTFRPDFSPPWMGRSHLTQVTVHRLTRLQAVEVIRQVAHDKALPPEVVEQIVAKTDGVPLFVEELTKMVLESGLLQEREDHYALAGPLPPLAIPATLHDSLMARLDRLATVKAMAQLAATLGREFSYELLQAVSPWDEGALQHGLHQLVAAEFLYQRGVPPQATYLFKHALIQDAAYQSLLRSTRQQYHQRIAQVLEARFPEVCATQPELLAQRYTEAGFPVQAIPYWQQAGQRAVERSANAEAISHLTKGLELLPTLPDTPERAQQELDMLTILGPALIDTRGQAAPEVLQAYARAREICQQVGETPQLFQVLRGLWLFYMLRLELRTAQELAEHLLTLAQHVGDPALLLEAHFALGGSLNYRGEFAAAQAHYERGIALYDSQQHRGHAFRYGQDPGVFCRGYAAVTLWWLGYPDQALQRSHEALTLAQELAHPFSLAYALVFAAWLHQLRRDEHLTHERAEAILALAAEQGFAILVAWGTFLRGWALAERSPEPGAGQGQREEGIVQMQQGMAAFRATGAEANRPYFLALVAEAAAKVGQIEEGLTLLAEALAVTNDKGERRWEAELYRLKGELLLQSGVRGPESGVSTPHSAEVEACFRRALDIARQQQAKSLELRAAMSLSRLWQRQGKRAAAHQLLAEVYHWFTEGFDTPDLQEAKALLVTSRASETK
jgi:TOMM system kinase/cyclase fusion protein